jgi:hypothetical protein
MIFIQFHHFYTGTAAMHTFPQTYRRLASFRGVSSTATGHFLEPRLSLWKTENTTSTRLHKARARSEAGTMHFVMVVVDIARPRRTKCDGLALSVVCGFKMKCHKGRRTGANYVLMVALKARRPKTSEQPPRPMLDPTFSKKKKWTIS